MLSPMRREASDRFLRREASRLYDRRLTFCILLLAMFLILASCGSARQFTISERTDDFGVKVLEGSPLALRQGGYDVGVTLIPEMRDNEIDQLVVLYFDHKGKKPHKFNSVSIVVEELPLYYSDLQNYASETTSDAVYESFNITVKLDDLRMFIDSRFIRMKGDLETKGFRLDGGTKRHLESFYQACLTHVQNR